MWCPFRRTTCKCGKVKCVGTSPAKVLSADDSFCKDFLDCPIYVKKQAEIEKLL